MTWFGDGVVFAAVGIAAYWCWNKRAGEYMLSVGLAGTAVGHCLKNLFRVPRPWLLDEEFEIVESARARAGGYSFPSVYAWTQCLFVGGSLMLSVADIPIGPVHFTGIIGVVYLDGKEHRIATYLGARPVSIKGGRLVVKQGKYELTAQLIEKHPHPLAAPVAGEMSRTIHESASCKASYRLTKGGKTLLDIVSDRATFEYEYPL